MNWRISSQCELSKMMNFSQIIYTIDRLFMKLIHYYHSHLINQYYCRKEACKMISMLLLVDIFSCCQPLIIFLPNYYDDDRVFQAGELFTISLNWPTINSPRHLANIKFEIRYHSGPTLESMKSLLKQTKIHLNRSG